MPTIRAGSKPVPGNINPVTLVATVVMRKSAVHVGSLDALNMPNTTITPVNMPTKLKMTCSCKKADADIPKIMVRTPVVVFPSPAEL